jgi:phosphogluconate dehydratase
MSGASGKVAAAIHLYPEACEGGPISKIRTGDKLRLDAVKGELICFEEIDSRSVRSLDYPHQSHGRELFSRIRSLIDNGEKGAGII